MKIIEIGIWFVYFVPLLTRDVVTVIDISPVTLLIVIIFPLTTLEDVNVINKSFTAIEAGVYQVCYYVSDEAGNTTFISYKIVIK